MVPGVGAAFNIQHSTSTGHQFTPVVPGDYTEAVEAAEAVLYRFTPDFTIMSGCVFSVDNQLQRGVRGSCIMLEAVYKLWYHLVHYFSKY